MYEFPEIPASRKPRVRKFSECMWHGSHFQFTMFIDDFQRRLANADEYKILPFFRTSLSRRSILYSIMANYLNQGKLNVSAECWSKGIDYSNAMKTLKAAQKLGYLDENYYPSEEMVDEFMRGVGSTLNSEATQHLAASMVCSRVMAGVADQLEK